MTTLLELQELAASMHGAAIEMLEHPENTGPDSLAHQCYKEIRARLELVSEAILDVKIMQWSHVYDGRRPQ